MELGSLCTRGSHELRAPCPPHCYATAATADIGLDHCAGMQRACDTRATAGRTPTATGSTTSSARNQQVRCPLLASRLFRPDKTSGQRILPKDRTALHTCPPLAAAESIRKPRCPCGQVCSPVLLRRLLLTQSEAFQSEEQPPKLPLILGDPGPHLRHGSLSP